MNLRAIDLNLLVILDSLIEERSVRRAGDRIGLSQSATSHALDRLRKVLDDEILVRTTSGMEPTARAQAIASPLKAALEGLSAALEPPHFDPSGAVGNFTVGVETYETIRVLPGLVGQVRREAPNMELTVRSGAVYDILSWLDQGRMDVGIGRFHGLPDRFMTCALMSDRYVCAMRSGHPLSQVPMTLDRYLSATHLLISMSGATEDVVDTTLEKLNHRRNVVMRLPHGLAALMALADSDVIATVARGAASTFAGFVPLTLVAPPFDIAKTEFRLIWSRRLHENPAHQWLRRKIIAIGHEAA